MRDPIQKILQELMQEVDNMEAKEKLFKREVAELDDELWEMAQELHEAKKQYFEKAEEVHQELVEKMEAEFEARMEESLKEMEERHDCFWNQVYEEKELDRNGEYMLSAKDGKIYQKIQSKIFH